MHQPSADPPIEPSPLAPPEWAQAAGCPRIGRYLLGPELGHGGFGTVFAAWDPVLGRMVAIKRMHTQTAAHTARLLREARHQARVEHPGICRIIEADASGDGAFIAMQLLKGRNLAQLGPGLKPEAAARIMADVAAAVHAAHRAGLIHRDIKPQNIMVEQNADGTLTPFIMDFGVARDLELGPTDQTLSWAITGTPAFMSPQQARCDPASPADDVYSLGATLYALLSGAPPYEATTLVGLLRQHESAPAPSITTYHTHLPRDLDTIAHKCLEFDPTRRYASAFELEADLRRFLAGEPILARPVGRIERAWRQVKRHRILALTAAVSLAIILGLLGRDLRQRALAQRQIALAERFGMAAKEVESLMRIERLLPPHDLRSAEARVRQELAALKGQMDQLGAPARGPGHYALGRGYMALQDWETAIQALQTAWDAGFQTPDVAASLGSAHAELYESTFFLRGGFQGMTPEQQQDLKARHLAPARQWLERGRGATVDSPHLIQARLRWTEGHPEEAVPLCDRAMAETPWIIEAMPLKVRALFEVFARRTKSRPEELQTMAELVRLARESLAQARSDSGRYGFLIRLLSQVAVLDSEGGRPSAASFRDLDPLYATALQIHPEDAQLVEGRQHLQLREAFLRLSRGEDLRGFIRECLERFVPLRGTPTGQSLQLAERDWWWLLGEAQWRRGEDPRPALQRGLHIAYPSITTAEIQYVQARHLWRHGQSPEAALREAEALCQTLRRDNPTYFYNSVVEGEVLLTRAEWESWTGRNPVSSIQRGLAALRDSLHQKEAVAYPYFHLSLLEALEARRLLAAGRNAGSAVQEALRAGRRAVELRPDHFRSHLGLAEAHLAQAAADRAVGREPKAAFAAARKALDAADRQNPTDFRLAFSRARMELEEAVPLEGGAALPSLARAQAAARRGLKVKEDAPELHWALAEALRREAQARRTLGQGDGDWLAKARQAADRALALCPDLAPARATRSALVSEAETRSGAVQRPGSAPGALSAATTPGSRSATAPI